MSKLILKSPAKINLYLKLINKRPDGFHNIETVFQRIDLFDEIIFKSNNSLKIKITCDHPHVPVGPKNLVYKVAKLFQDKYGVEKGVDIRIRKRIPVAAGLAGGSSNAATALVGLNKFWGLGLPQNALVRHARQIGSDVAFFLYDFSWALGTERGDKIKKINTNNKIWQVLVVPRIKMYSGRVYEASKLQLTKQSDSVTILIHHLKKNNILGLRDSIVNDLEGAVLKLSPKLSNLKKKLKSLKAKGVMVSGSGPAIFGLTSSKGEAERLASILKRRYSQVFVVKTL